MDIERENEPYIDASNLLLFDYVQPEKYTHAQLKENTREATQMLFNTVFSLPIKSSQDGVFVQLPEETFKVPRAMPEADQKPLTKWEAFAKKKGITKRKKERFVFDERTQTERPRFGYKSKDPLENWLVEVPEGGDPMKDWIAEKEQESKQKIEKNKKQHKKNQENRLLAISKVSTASMGRFDAKLQNEEKVKAKPFAKKQRKEFVDDRDKQRKIAQKVGTGSAEKILNVRKATANFAKTKKR